MGRIFALLAALSITLLITVGISVYWLAAQELQNSKQRQTTALAQGIALSIASKVDQINETIDRFGHDSELTDAVLNGDQEQLKRTLIRLQNLLPGAMNLRFLLPETNVLDKSEIPHMGYADIELVRHTFQQNLQPKIQGELGPNRHLAIARKITINDQIIGVILASMNYDFLKRSVTAANLKQGLIELKQDKLLMETTGDINIQRQQEFDPIKISGTDWVLRYWTADDHQLINFYLLLCVILLPCVIVLFVFVIFNRKIATLLRMDQTSILQAIKDMMDGRAQGNYPVFFDELKIVVSSIMQYRRTINNNPVQTESLQQDNDLNLDDLFDEEPEDPNLEISQTSNQQSTPENVGNPEDNFFELPVDAGKPISMPEFDKPVVMPEIDEPKEQKFGIPEIPLNNLDNTHIIFRAYDIRGIVGQSLTKEIVHDIGRAFGSAAQLKGRKTVIIARDCRNSSAPLCETLTQGILSTGMNVLDLGMVPTPVLYFAAHHHEDHTAIMLTGSHNPADYNGMKMVLAGDVLYGENIQALRHRIEDENFVIAKQPGQLTANNLLGNEYIGTICEAVHLARPMKVVVDCGNGVAGEIAPKLLKTIGCDVIELFCDFDGNFPNHHPDPSKPENLQDLAAAVKYYQADLGFAFDGDGDRLVVIDSQSKIIWPDRLMMLLAKEVLKSDPGAEVIFDVKCSRNLASQITKYGGKPLMYKSGHSLIKAKLKETGAKLAGEMSGHIFFNDRWYGFDDAMYAAARTIEILSQDSRNSCEVFAQFPESLCTPELNMELAEGESVTLIEKLIASADFGDGKVSTLDGMRVDFEDGWGLVKASNTTPSLVFRFEADNQDALDRIQQQFKNLLLQVKLDIQFPF